MPSMQFGVQHLLRDRHQLPDLQDDSQFLESGNHLCVQERVLPVEDGHCSHLRDVR